VVFPVVRSAGHGIERLAPSNDGAGESKMSPLEFITTIAAPSTNGGSLKVSEIVSCAAKTSESAAGEVLTKSVWADAGEIGARMPSPAKRIAPIIRWGFRKVFMFLGYASN
jgi:hypothetical protein